MIAMALACNPKLLIADRSRTGGDAAFAAVVELSRSHPPRAQVASRSTATCTWIAALGPIGVGDEELRIAGKRHGDHRSLALPPESDADSSSPGAPRRRCPRRRIPRRPRPACAPRSFMCSSIDSTIWSPTA